MRSPISAGLGRFGGSYNTAQDGSARFRWAKGRRFASLNPADVIEDMITIECDLRMWKRPGDSQMVLVRVDGMCPRCAHPWTFRPQPKLHFEYDAEGWMSMQAVLECKAHWPHTDRNGQVTGRMRKCAWRARLIDGAAHNVRCPTAQGRGKHECRCGSSLPKGEYDRVVRS